MPRRTRQPTRVESLTHADDSRPNIPTAEYQPIMTDEQDADDLTVPAPPPFIQEKAHPKVLIDDLMRLSYLRDRLSLARDLLTESGNVFVHIFVANLHEDAACSLPLMGSRDYLPLARDEAAVYHEFRSGDERRLVRCEEQHAVSDFNGFARSAAAVSGAPALLPQPGPA